MAKTRTRAAAKIEQPAPEPEVIAAAPVTPDAPAPEAEVAALEPVAPVVEPAAPATEPDTVTVTIVEAPTSPMVVMVNGRALTIPVGKPTAIPRSHLGALRDASGIRFTI